VFLRDLAANREEIGKMTKDIIDIYFAPPVEFAQVVKRGEKNL
jgi:hypothetical protein